MHVPISVSVLKKRFDRRVTKSFLSLGDLIAVSYVALEIEEHDTRTLRPPYRPREGLVFHLVSIDRSHPSKVGLALGLVRVYTGCRGRHRLDRHPQ